MLLLLHGLEGRLPQDALLTDAHSAGLLSCHTVLTGLNSADVGSASDCEAVIILDQWRANYLDDVRCWNLRLLAGWHSVLMKDARRRVCIERASMRRRTLLLLRLNGLDEGGLLLIG